MKTWDLNEGKYLNDKNDECNDEEKEVEYYDEEVFEGEDSLSSDFDSEKIHE